MAGSGSTQVVRQLLVSLGVAVEPKTKREIRELDKKVEEVKKSFGDLAKKADTAAKAIEGFALKAAKIATAAVVGLGAAAVKVGADFESMRTQLSVVEGSAEAGARAFDRLREFAVKNSLEIDRVVQSYIRLKNLGLDPSMEAMQAYGEIAAANGKTTIDFVEAVADAVTSENERLREFGIKAAVEGDKVRYTFRGVTTEVENNAAAIERYLQGLSGLEGIAGGLAAQAATTKGAFTALSNATQTFLDKIAQGGLLTAVSEVARELGNMASNGGSFATVIGEALGDAVRGLWKWLMDVADSLRDVSAHDIREGLHALGRTVQELADAALTLFNMAVDLVDAMGGMENAVYGAAGAYAALKLAALGLPGVMAGVGLSIGFALGKLIADIRGFTDEIERLERRTIILRASASTAMRLMDRPADLAEFSDDEFADLSSRLLEGGVSQDIVDRLARARAWEIDAQERGQRAADEKAKELEYRNAQEAAAPAMGPEVPAHIRRRNERERRREMLGRIGGSGRTGPSGKGRQETIEDILGRGLGGGLHGAPLASGVRPTLGTTINRVTQTFAPRVDIKIDLPHRPGELPGDFSKRIGDEVDRRLDRLHRRGFDHFSGAPG